MALDLFANFERYSNSSLFYRVTSSTPSTFTVRLSDISAPNTNYSTTYYVQSSLNNGAYTDFNPNVNGFFITNLSFNTAFPCVCSIGLKVYTSEGHVLLSSIALSARFVDSLPTVDWIAYPSNYIDEINKQYLPLNASNFRQYSPGIYFYGEGHTETINLSSKGVPAGWNATWFVGNEYKSYGQTATVSMTSAPQTDRISYPIRLWATNSVITTAGPYITYTDAGSGSQSFYPFYNSSSRVDGKPVYVSYKSGVQVLPYPTYRSSDFTSPFTSSNFELPINYGTQIFTGIITNPAADSLLTETFIGTQWELEATSDVGEWYTKTDVLSSTFGYQFPLSYDQTASEIQLPFLKASPTEKTTVSLAASSYSVLNFNFSPHDWLPKTVHYEHKDTAVIGPLPFVKLHIPNYYNIKGTAVPITVIGSPKEPLTIQTLTLKSSHSSETLVLSGNESLSGTMVFDKIGVAELSAIAVLKNTVSNQTLNTSVIFPEILELVIKYDEDPNEDFFQSSLTPLKLTYGYLPRLSPNEWAVADNVNSIIEKIYTTIDDLDDYTKLYEKKDKFYGWIGPKAKRRSYLPKKETPNPIYTWEQLECTDQYIETIETWGHFECRIPDSYKTWDYHECDYSLPDPSCLQRHCLEWKWKNRKQGASDVNVTWKTSKLNAEFEKKWVYERCQIDSEPINCDQGTWNLSTIDHTSFPIPSCNWYPSCAVIDVEVNPITNQLVVAYPTEIHLVENDYFAGYTARHGISDEFFAFQNIVGLTISSEGRVIVLDGTIPRVSVFKIVNNKFVIYSTWGSYGLLTNPKGFNKPRDIHVDAKNSVWIADTGNNCIKKLTIIGKPLLLISHEKFDVHPPLSVCVDSKSNVHCLTETGVVVFDENGDYIFDYTFPSDISGVKKINTSYNREMIYISHTNGIVKYFRTGTISHYTIQDLKCADDQPLQGYNSMSQDKHRNLYITVNDKILRVSDLQKLVESKAALPPDLYWKLEDLMIHKEEYIQPWVYLKSFHRLWDNVELLRNSLFYNLEGCKAYVKPTYAKTDLIIGQNEIVSNAVINRLSEQLWANLQGLINYFDPNCEN